MAKQTTKANLRSTTAVKAPALTLVATSPRKGDNRKRPITEAAVDQMVNAAISDDDVANQKKGTAQQRMAAALMAQHEFWVGLGDAIPGYEGQHVPSLADCFHDAEIRKGYVMMFRDRFIKPADKNASADEQVRVELANAAKRTLIDTSIKAAAILVKDGVTFYDFDNTTGMFEVKPDILLPLDAEWRGILGGKNAPATILLDLTGYSAVNTKPDPAKPGQRVETTPIRVKASVSQLFAAEATKWVDKATGKIGRKPRMRKEWTLKQLMEAVGPAETCPLDGDYLIEALLAKFANATDKNMIHTSKGWTAETDLTLAQEQEQARPGFDKEKRDKLLKVAGKAA